MGQSDSGGENIMVQDLTPELGERFVLPESTADSTVQYGIPEENNSPVEGNLGNGMSNRSWRTQGTWGF